MITDSDEIVSLTGSNGNYRYRELTEFPSDQVANYVARTRALFGQIAKIFSAETNTEWLIRSYLSLKFVLGSTVMANSAMHAESENLKVTLPYLNYYTLLNCSRSFLLTLPCMSWRGDKTIEMTHNNILKTTTDRLKLLDPEAGQTLGPRLWAAKEQRDLFSYRFPASGLALFGDRLVSCQEAVAMARLLTELSQVNLACLESAVRKRGATSMEVADVDDVWHLLRYQTKDNQFIDDEDHWRVGSFARKFRHPVELVTLATDGLVEDFFGVWESEHEYGFDASREWNLLLDLW